MDSRAKKIIALVNNSQEKENKADNGQSAECVAGSTSLAMVRSDSPNSYASSKSFYEDSDDSVRDPDYINQSPPDSTDEEENVNSQDTFQITYNIETDHLVSEANQAGASTTSTEHTCLAKEPLPSTSSYVHEIDQAGLSLTTMENMPSFSATEPVPSASRQDNETDQVGLSITATNNMASVSATEPVPGTSRHDNDVPTPTKRGKKRQKNEDNWKRNIAKRMRNLGKSYESSKTKKIISERKMKEPCKETCKFKCGTKITENQRLQINEDYWKLGSIEQQWTFISNSAEAVIPQFRYVRVNPDGTCFGPKRVENHSFHFTVSGNKIRVCKLFFANTLGINYRPIDTALQKKNKDTNISIMKDNRGSHGKQPKVDEGIRSNIKQFIEAIPKIDSHYTRAKSQRHYIDGSKSVADLHRDYVQQCKSSNTPFGNYVMFYRIFNEDFNISFFSPKKDLCEECEIYKNSTEAEKESLKESYEKHLQEKELSREEKAKDKANKSLKVAVYDLQAVHQCPKGDVSVFYYKSKLNVLNLTVYDLQTNNVSCYVWDESSANRGVNEIGTCVYKYLEELNNTCQNQNAIDVVFYSDNCAGQQKNKFMIAMYLFAVQSLANIRSITHKYLIKGHTQNEGDSAHSQIEKQVKRQLRSGPMYTPDAFIAAIKTARKKSEPFKVKEMCFADIYDWKKVCTQMGVLLQKDEEDNSIKIGEMKMIKVVKDEPRVIYFKKSYSEEDYKKATVIKRRKEINVEVPKAYDAKVGISERKKADLMELVNKNVIPRYYRPFFESL